MKCLVFRWCLLAGIGLVALSGVRCAVADVASGLTWSAYRLRADAELPLNFDHGWAAPENQGARLPYDQPFRLRIEVAGATGLNELRLQARFEGGDWQFVGLSAFPYPLYATPPVSLITEAGYAMGEEAEDLLAGSRAEHEDGIGLVGVSSTPLFHLEEGSMEWEWPLIIRRFADGPSFQPDDAVFEIRVVDMAGKPLPGMTPVAVEMFAPDGHLGGTFVETPARIGPFQSTQGTLYFLMEPTETDNRFMMMASHDFGRSWRELDGANRPQIGDLEGVGAVFQDGVIHIVHQISEAVYHHAFATDDLAETANQWLIDSALIAEHTEPPTQVAAIRALPNGELLAVYGNATGGVLSRGSAKGVWATEERSLERSGVTGLSGFQMETLDNGVGFVVYTAEDGSGWLWQRSSRGGMAAWMMVSDTLGVEDEANGAFLPVLVTPTRDAVLLYRKADGSLWERRFSNRDGLSLPRLVTAGPVVTSAVDSDQVGADAVIHGETIHVLFIDEATRSLNHTFSAQAGEWTQPRVVIDGIDAAWVRGAILRNGDKWCMDSSTMPAHGVVRA